MDSKEEIQQNVVGSSQQTTPEQNVMCTIFFHIWNSFFLGLKERKKVVDYLGNFGVWQFAADKNKLVHLVLKGV